MHQSGVAVSKCNLATKTIFLTVSTLKFNFQSTMNAICVQVKNGSPILLCRNLKSPKLYNGKTMIIKLLSNNIIEAKLMTKKGTRHTIFIQIIQLCTTELHSNLKDCKMSFIIN